MFAMFPVPVFDEAGGSPGSGQPPIAVDDVVEIVVNNLAIIPVLDNDYDPNGLALSVVSVTQPVGP